jgi:DNA-binding Lrp family transcriptional regulator
VKRLEQDGVFRGFHASVDPEWLGIGLAAMVAVRLRRHESQEVERFWEHALAMPEAVGVSHVSGVNDFLVHAVVRDTDHLRELAVSGLNTLPEVIHIETSLIFEHVSKPTLPDYRI